VLCGLWRSEPGSTAKAMLNSDIDSCRTAENVHCKTWLASLREWLAWNEPTIPIKFWSQELKELQTIEEDPKLKEERSMQKSWVQIYREILGVP
jgi:hypothetical protein